MRSLLFVPGDRPERFEKAIASGADAIILDLEDSVLPAAKDKARGCVGEFLARLGTAPLVSPSPPRGEGARRADEGDPSLALSQPSPSSGPAGHLLPAGEKGKQAAAAGASDSPALQRPPNCVVFVRVNPLDSDDLEKDLGVLASGLPDGIVLPKAEGAASVRMLSVHVSRKAGAAIPILPIATETAAAIFQLGTYAQVGPEICGLTWGAEDLPAAIGALSAREADGGYTEPYRMVRSLALFAAHAAGVPAIETVYPDIRDAAGLEAYARRGRRDGFTGMLAIHPAQVEVINRAFTPSGEEIARAERIVAAFAASPEAGAIQLDGRMLDRPHLKLAMAVIGAARGL